jgi:hypothetical protein
MLDFKVINELNKTDLVRRASVLTTILYTLCNGNVLGRFIERSWEAYTMVNWSVGASCIFSRKSP